MKRAIKLRIWKRDKFICQYCGITCIQSAHGKNRITVDHIRARVFGGKNDSGNLVTCCFECNNKKARFENLIIYKEA